MKRALHAALARAHMPHSHDPVSLGSPRFSTVEHGAFLVTSAFFPARLVLPPHTHERTVLAVTLAGRWTSSLGSVSCESTPGFVLTEPAGDRHANHFAAGGARVLIVQPDPASHDLLRPCEALLASVHHRQSGHASASAVRLSRELRRTDDLSSLAVQGLCLEILAAAAREVAVVPRAAERWMTRVEDYLRAHFREAPSLQTLAAVGDVHPSHLTRAFRARHGISPAQFIRRRRVEWAAGALSRPALSIAEIAQRAGFADQSHFTRSFRDLMGITPARLRAVTVSGRHASRPVESSKG